MRRLAFAVLLLAAPPLARACDSEAMSAELTAVCNAALIPAAEWVRSVRAHATEPEARALDRALAVAEESCATGDPSAGAREATRLARLAGRIEVRAGITDPIWPDRLAVR